MLFIFMFLYMYSHPQVNARTVMEFSVPSWPLLHMMTSADAYVLVISSSLGTGREFRVEACCPFQEGARLREVEPSY